MTITFVGHGYVGLVTAAIFADLGNTVWVIGHTPQKVENLKKGIIPIYEPGLEEIVKRNVSAKRLLFTLSYTEAVASSDVVFIAVGTPPRKTGDADLSTVFSVAETIGKHLDGYTVVATKSTVPVGTNKRVREIIEEVKPKSAIFDIASCPEFLREGTAIQDTMHPDRVVIGTESKKAKKVLVELHDPIDTRIISTNLETAELIKYASNSFLATKISFANAIAKLSEITGADGLKVLEGMGMDRRIGKEFLYPGPGYGGSCFPKDVKALISIAKDFDYSFSLLDEVEKINDRARRDIVHKAKRLLKDLRGKKIAVLGLSFKPNTDDMRDAPAIDIIEFLQKDGAEVFAFDPQAMENAKKIFKDLTFCKDSYEAIKDAELLIILTDWDEFKGLDLDKILKLMKKPNIIDARNIYSPAKVAELGFTYMGVGR
ncbi:MAG TPA: UDP-glucose/GDP-mannose dehydrogenase family protein [Candidatus Saccharimonadales bacterium]|nr:UDP-glucose/GDP-mannose dehydrogenase family protein [Candidatus Saccharimonadales bacterium]